MMVMHAKNCSKAAYILRVAKDEALITHTLILMASKDLSQRRACWMMSMYEDMRDRLGLAAA